MAYAITFLALVFIFGRVSSQSTITEKEGFHVSFNFDVDVSSHVNRVSINLANPYREYTVYENGAITNEKINLGDYRSIKTTYVTIDTRIRTVIYIPVLQTTDNYGALCTLYRANGSIFDERHTILNITYPPDPLKCKIKPVPLESRDELDPTKRNASCSLVQLGNPRGTMICYQDGNLTSLSFTLTLVDTYNEVKKGWVLFEKDRKICCCSVSNIYQLDIASCAHFVFLWASPAQRATCRGPTTNDSTTRLTTSPQPGTTTSPLPYTTNTVAEQCVYWHPGFITCLALLGCIVLIIVIYFIWKNRKKILESILKVCRNRVGHT